MSGVKGKFSFAVTGRPTRHARRIQKRSFPSQDSPSARWRIKPSFPPASTTAQTALPSPATRTGATVLTSTISLQNLVGLDLRERDRFGQRFFRLQIHARPVAFVRPSGRDKIPSPRAPGRRRIFLRRCDKRKRRSPFFIARKMEPRREIPHARPRGFAVLHKLRPRIGFGFGFHEPVIHAKTFTINDLRFTIAP